MKLHSSIPALKSWKEPPLAVFDLHFNSTSSRVFLVIRLRSPWREERTNVHRPTDLLSSQRSTGTFISKSLSSRFVLSSLAKLALFLEVSLEFLPTFVFPWHTACTFFYTLFSCGLDVYVCVLVPLLDHNRQHQGFVSSTEQVLMKYID